MHWPTFDLAQWSFALLAALCIGLGKTGFSGTSMISILLMAQLLPARESTGVILPLLILADIFAVTMYRRFASAAVVLRLLLPAFVGILVGWWLMPYIPSSIFRMVIGWISLILVVLILVQKLAPRVINLASEHPLMTLTFGWMAGVTTMLANAAGPVVSIYLLACKLPKMEFVGTGAWFFFTVNVIKVPFSASMGLINPHSLWFNLCLAPGVVGGVFLGRWLISKINQQAFEWLMIAFTFLGALRMILS